MRILASNRKEADGTALDPSSAAAIGAFAKSLRSLTNYEVWERTESAVLQLAPDSDRASQDWWRVQALLDELQWRLSGLEGAGPSTPQLPATVSGGRAEEPGPPGNPALRMRAGHSPTQ
jgi:hypothetical protein